MMKNLFLLLAVMAISVAYPQSNECTSATLIPDVSDWCSGTGQYSNVSATPSSGKLPTCWSSVDKDVWFKFIATEQNVQISVIRNGANPIALPKLVIYNNNPAPSGTCVNLPETSGCEPSIPGKDTVTAYHGGLKVGEEYIVRVSSDGNAGTFQICANSFASPVSPGQDCNTAQYLCNKDPLSIEAVNGDGNVAETMPCNSPPAPEFNSTWFYWKASNSGKLTMDITPSDVNADVDWAIFGLRGGDCNQKANFRCCVSGSGNPADQNCRGQTGMSLTDTDQFESGGCLPSNNHYTQYLQMQQDCTYAMLINNFNQQSGFTIEFGGDGLFTQPSANFTANPAGGCSNLVGFNASFKNADSYSWDFGAGATPATSNNANPGQVSYSSSGTKTATLTVTHSTCTEIKTVTFTIGGTIDASIATANTGACDRFGGVSADATVTPIGGSQPFTYQWDDPQNQTTQTATGLSAGTYNVTVKDANNCTATKSVTIDKIIILSTSETDPTCGSCSDGSATVNVTGTGQAPFSYRWDDNGEQTTQTATGLAAGNYTVTVTDVNGCFDTSKVTIGVVGLDDLYQIEKSVMIYPNPSEDQINILFQLEGNQRMEVVVYDVVGKMVSTIQNGILQKGDHLMNLNKNDLNGNGIYIIRFKIDDMYISKRVVFNN